MNTANFFHNTDRYKFIELKGKDPRNDISRWRACGYYKPHLAETLFFYSEDEYSKFCEANKAKTDPAVYTQWRQLTDNL